MPGYLNSVVKFREKYNIKEMDEDGLKTLDLLNHQIRPFILRRKKIDVIKSLPEKIENKVYIELPKKQKMLYLKVLNDTKKEMDEIISQGEFQKSRVKILQLLTKLRQICIDPSVMYDNYNGESIKIEELVNIVKENVENGHKVLIFSSFRRVLDNVSKVFSRNDLSYYMINGSVKGKDRMDMVDKFNKDNTNCFLITLKAGGTGLNLIGADVVIHLDIWWNPQVENQATDRAHRIGQKNKVTVIKLVTKGTIEERIIELQEKKKQLSDNLIEGNSDVNNLLSLTEKDIKKLLSNNDL
jgi:SNF2-related protein